MRGVVQAFAGLVLWGLAIAAVAAVPDAICRVEVCPYPGRDPAMWDALYAARSGKVYTGLCTEGESAHLYQYDPARRANRMLVDVAEFLGERGRGIRASGKIHNKPVEDDEGQLYFVPINNGSGPRSFDFNTWRGGHWLKYDPRRDKVEDLGLVDDGVGIYALTIDTRRKLLFGLGFTGYLYRFDIQRRQTTNLGRVSNWDVCREIFCDDQGCVYGSFPTARVWKYDARTEKVLDLSVTTPFDPTIFPTQLRNPMIDRTYDWRAVAWDARERVAYGITCGSGSTLFRFDPHAGKEGVITALPRLCAVAMLDGHHQDIPFSPLAFALDSQRRRIYFVPSSRPYSVEGVAETLGSDRPHHLIMYDLTRRERRDCGALRAADGRRVFGCEGASVGPDGALYLCGQVEVRDPAQATARVGDVPVALHLIIYRAGE